MRALIRSVATGSQAVSYVLGGFVLALAVTVAATAMSPTEIVGWARDMFGHAFIALMITLVVTAVYAWVRLLRQPGSPVWLEAGLQAANAVTTLALTFTLLGITLGIGTLAEQKLTPETVQGIVHDLTARFSLAFMTTVVGMPLSAVLRTLLMVTDAHQRASAES